MWESGDLASECCESMPLMAAVNRGVWHCVCVMWLHQEMKRVRTEQIQYAVTQYLKRRQYIDTDGSLKGAKLSQSAEEMAASLTGDCTSNEHISLTLNNSNSDAHLHLSFCLPWAVQTESSCANVVSAAPCQSDPQQYETQFSRLRSFLQGEEWTLHKHTFSML